MFHLYATLSDELTLPHMGAADRLPICCCCCCCCCCLNLPDDDDALPLLLFALCHQDPYDKRRPALFKDIKKTSNEWVGAYARGGNVRKQSARSFYVAVDSLQVFSSPMRVLMGLAAVSSHHDLMMGVHARPDKATRS